MKITLGLKLLFKVALSLNSVQQHVVLFLFFLNIMYYKYIEVIIHRVNCIKIRPCLGFVKFTVQNKECLRKEFGTESNITTVTYLIHLS